MSRFLSRLLRFCGLFSLFVVQVKLHALLDLNQKAPSFVLETKRLRIPGCAHAHNPSFIRWQGKILMSFRVRDPQRFPINRTGLIWLDDTFKPLGKPQFLQLEMDPAEDLRAQDVRLFEAPDGLYIFYNQRPVNIISRMSSARLLFDGENFTVQDQEYFAKFEGVKSHINEKNWVPFLYQDKILLTYSQSPHRIFQPLFGTGECSSFSDHPKTINWRWGELRGGTPALRDGNHYLAFFHTCEVLASKQSRGKKIKNYFMGAYLFATEPPFQITHVSPKPIFCKNLYQSAKTPCKMLVVFPGGLIIDEKYVWVAFGRQDCEAWVMKMDKKKLIESLVSVESF